MRELMSYLPENYQASRETAAFQRALQPEAELIWETRDDLLAQLSPYTATWGLALWESGLGLAASGGLALDQRRKQVVARLQGRAATTAMLILDIAEEFLGVPVTVIEAFEQYRVELEVSSGGVLPAGLDLLKRQLDEIMPAHLDWGFVIPLHAHIRNALALGPRYSEIALPMRGSGAAAWRQFEEGS